MCLICLGEAEPPPSPPKPKKPADENRPLRRDAKTTIRQRLEQCGKSCSIVQVRRVRLPDGSVVDGSSKFEGKLELSIREVCDHVGADPDTYWELELLGEEVTELEELSGQRPPQKGAA